MQPLQGMFYGKPSVKIEGVDSDISECVQPQADTPEP